MGDWIEMLPPQGLRDRYGRDITYLRVSVTDRCDLRCVYCMSEHMTFLPRRDLLSLEELNRLCSAFVQRGVKKLRITGGEPLVRRNIMWLFEALGRHLDGGGLEELTLTTNGTQLKRFAGALKAAGVARVNVSLDTLDANRFRTITRWGDLGDVMEGLAAADAAGLAVKINTVALKGANEDEFDDLIAFAHGRGYDLTFIETMPLGEVDADRTDQYLPLSIVRARLMDRWTLDGHRPQHRRAGPLRARARERRPARLHHADDPQFLRKLQPRPPHLHGHALHVPRPGGRRRSARAATCKRQRRRPARRYRRGHRRQAEGPRFRHRPPYPQARRLPPYERHRRVVALPPGNGCLN